MPSPRTRSKVGSRRRRVNTRADRVSSGELEFNPNSFNAQFASLHAKLTAHKNYIDGRFTSQDESLGEIKDQTRKTNGRVTALETGVEAIKTEKKISKAYIAGIAAAVSFVVGAAGIALKVLIH
jgi:hypothetical protein